MAGPISRHRRTFAGCGTRCLEVDGDGPAFLLLHGYSDSADTWRDLLLQLARRGRRAMAIDLPSHGRADAHRPDEPGLDQLVACSREAARWLGPGTVVVGNSLGGTVALLVAETTEGLGGVVPIGPGSFAHPWWLHASLHPATVKLLGFVPPVFLVPSYVTTGLLAGMSPRAIPTYVRHVTSFARQRRLRSLLTGLAVEAVSPYDHSKITCPVTLVWGERDLFSLPRGAQGLIDAVPGLRYEPFEGVGHTPQQEVPARLADLLVEVAPADRDPVVVPIGRGRPAWRSTRG